MYGRYSAHKGPRGGVEFRGWTGDVTFRIVSRYVAWPHLSAENKAWAEATLAANRAKKIAAREDSVTWARMMRGGR